MKPRNFVLNAFWSILERSFGHSGPFCEVCAYNWYKQPDGYCADCAESEGSIGATVAIAATVGVRTRAEGGRFSLQLSSEHSLKERGRHLTGA